MKDTSNSCCNGTDIGNKANLENEVVWQNFDSNVVLVGVLVDRRGPEGKLKQGLEPGGVDLVGLLPELVTAKVHELDDEVALEPEINMRPKNRKIVFLPTLETQSNSFMQYAGF